MNKLKNRKLWLFAIVAITFFAALAFFFLTKGNKSVEVNKISDSSIGLDFEISKDFERMDQEALKQMNPLFLYGFRPKDVDNVSCIVSQTERPKPGFVSPEFLKTGTLEGIKKSNPDAKLETWEEKDFGKEASGALLEVFYTENEVEIKRVELVATNDLRTTFAYCYSPKSLYSFYRSTFDKFISSIKIY